MQDPENIEIFNRICVTLFDKLYTAFPMPIELDMDDVAKSSIPQEASYEHSWYILSIGSEVISFLDEEGFLTHKSTRLEGSLYRQVRLTMKGLVVLGYVPTSVEKQEPLSSKIRGFVGEGLKEAGGEAVRQLVSKICRLALTAAPAIGVLIGKP